MTIDARTSPTMAVQIDGVTLQASEIECTDAIAPDVGSASITVPLRTRSFNGVSQTADPSITPRQAVSITSSSGYTWTGEVVAVEESAQGGLRNLRIDCHGDAAALERAYLSRARQINYNSGALFVADGPRDFNADGNADRSSGTFTVAGQTVNIHDDYGTARGAWSQTQAINHLLALAAEDAGLPLFSLSDPDGILDKVTTWQVAGLSVHAALQTIIGARSDAAWRADGATITVRRIPSIGGQTVDLTGPYIQSYSHARDGRSTVAGARAVGARKVWIVTVAHDVAAALLGGTGGGASGGLNADWTGQDVVDFQAGNESSPAYRAFRLSPAYVLPDGFSAGNARVLPGIPWRVVSVNAGTIFGGPGYGSPIAVFAKREGRFIDLTGQVSVQVRADQAGIMFQGGADWRAEYLRSDQVYLTLAIESASRLTATSTGGSGVQRSLVQLPAIQVRAVGAGYGVNAGGSMLTNTAIFRDDSGTMAELLEAWGRQYLTDRASLSWSEIGVAGGGPDPLDMIGSAAVRADAGTTIKTLACNTVISRRTVRWTPQGCMTSWSSAPLPANLNAIAGNLR